MDGQADIETKRQAEIQRQTFGQNDGKVDSNKTPSPPPPPHTYTQTFAAWE